MKTPKTSPKTVLSIHGHEPDIGILRNRVETLGYEFFDANGGSDGLRMLESLNPDLLIIDSILPDQSGFELCKNIKYKISVAPTTLILTSNFEVANESAQVPKSRCDGFFRKADFCTKELFDHPRFFTLLRYYLGEADRTQITEKMNETILILSQRKDLIEKLQKTIKQNYQLVPATTVDHGLKIIKSEAILCVIVDLSLKSLNASSFSRRVKKVGYNLAVLGIDSNLPESERANLRLAGFSEILNITFSGSLIQKIIKSQIESAKSRNYHRALFHATTVQATRTRENSDTFLHHDEKLTAVNSELKLQIEDLQKKLEQKEASLRKTKHDLKALSSVVSSFPGSPELRSSLQNALNKILVVTDANLGCIFLEKDGKVDSIIENRLGTSEDLLLDWRLLSGFLLRTARKSKKTIFIEALDAPIRMENTTVTSGEPFALCHRIDISGHFIGVVSVIGSHQQITRLKKDKLLVTMGTSIATAVEKSLITEDYALCARELSVVNRITAAVQKSDPERSFYKAIEAVVGDQECAGGMVHYYDEHRRELQLRCQFNIPSEFLSRLAKVRLGENQIERSPLSSGQPVITNSLSKNPLLYSMFRGTDVCSAVCLPIATNKRAKALLTFVSSERGKFSQQEIKIYDAIARQFSIIYDKNKINDDRNRRVALTQTLNRIIDVSSGHESLPVIQRVVLKELAANFSGWCFVGYIEADETDVQLGPYRAQDNLVNEVEEQFDLRLQGLSLPYEDSFYLNEIRQGKAIATKDVTSPSAVVVTCNLRDLFLEFASLVSTDSKRLRSPKGFAQIESLIIVPMIKDGKFLGGLIVASSGPLGEDDLGLLWKIADIVAGSVTMFSIIRSLKSVNDRYRYLLENTHEAILIIDKNERIIASNRAVDSVFEKSGETMSSNTLNALSPQLSLAVRSSIRSCPSLKSRNTRTDNAKINTLDFETGKEILIEKSSNAESWIHYHLRQLEDDTFLLVVRDLTENKRIQNQAHFLTKFNEAVMSSQTETDLIISVSKILASINLTSIFMKFDESQRVMRLFHTSLTPSQEKVLSRLAGKSLKHISFSVDGLPQIKEVVKDQRTILLKEIHPFMLNFLGIKSANLKQAVNALNINSIILSPIAKLNKLMGVWIIAGMDFLKSDSQVVAQMAQMCTISINELQRKQEKDREIMLQTAYINSIETLQSITDISEALSLLSFPHKRKPIFSFHGIFENNFKRFAIKSAGLNRTNKERQSTRSDFPHQIFEISAQSIFTILINGQAVRGNLKAKSSPATSSDIDDKVKHFLADTNLLARNGNGILANCSYVIFPLICHNTIWGAAGVLRDEIEKDELTYLEMLTAAINDKISNLNSVNNQIIIQERFEQLSNRFKSVVLIFDSIGRCLYGNDSAQNAFGYSSHQLRQLTILNLIDFGTNVKVSDWRLFAKKYDQSPSTVACKCSDGTLQRGECKISFLSDDTVLMTIDDVGTANSDTDELRNQGAIFQNLPAAGIVTDLNFKVLSWNAGAEKLYGWKSINIIGQPLPLIEEKRSGSSRSRLMSGLKKNGSWKSVVERPSATGERIQVESSAAFIFGDNGDPQGILHVDWDVRDSVSQMAELHLHQQLARVLVGEDVSEFRLLMDAFSSELVYASPSFSRLTGLKEGDVFTAYIEKILHADDIDDFLQIAFSPIRKSFDVRVHTRTGSYRTFRVTSSADMLDERKVIRISAHDISQLKQREDQLRNHNRELMICQKAQEIVMMSTNLPNALHDVLTVVTEYFKAKATAISLTSEDNDMRLVSASGDGRDLMAELQLTESTRAMFGQVLSTQKSIFVSADSLDFGKNSMGLSSAHQSIFGAIPIMSKSDVIGILQILVQGVDRIPQTDEKILSKITKYLSTVISKHQDINDEKLRLSSYEALLKISSKFSELGDQDTIIQGAFDELPSLVRCDAATFWCPDHHHVKLVGSRFYDQLRIDFPQSFILDESTPVGCSILYRKPQNVQDIEVEFPTLQAPSWKTIKAWICIPVKYRRDIIGVFCLGRSDGRNFSRIDEATLVTFANQCGKAFAQARQREENTETINFLKAKNELFHTVLGSDSIEAMAKTFLRTITTVSKAERGELLLLNGGSPQLIRNESSGKYSSSEIAGSLFTNELIERVKASYDPVFLEVDGTSKKNKRGLKKTLELMSSQRFQRLLAVSLSVSGSRLGALAVATKNNNDTLAPNNKDRILGLIDDMSKLLVKTQHHRETVNLFQDTKDYLSRLFSVQALLSNLTQLKRDEKSLANLLPKILDTISYDSSALYLVDQKQEKVLLKAHRNIPPILRQQLEELAVANQVFDKFEHLSEPVILDSEKSIKVFGPNFLTLNSKGTIITPIASEGRCLGLLIGFRFSDSDFANEEAAFLKFAGIEIGAVVQNIYSDIKESDRAKKIGALGKAITAIADECNLRSITEMITKEMESIIDADRIGLYLLDDNGYDLTLMAGKGISDDDYDILKTTAWDRHPGWVIRNKKPIFTNDATKDNRVWQPAGVKQTLSSIVIPIMTNDRCIGALVASSFTSKAFTKIDFNSLEMFAKVVQLGLQNIDLQDEVLKTSKKSDHCSANLHALCRVSSVIQSRTSFEEVVEKIAEQIVEGFNLQFSTIFIQNSTKKIFDLSSIAITKAIEPATASSQVKDKLLRSLSHGQIKNLSQSITEKASLYIIDENNPLFKSILNHEILTKFDPYGGVSTLEIVPLVDGHDLLGILIAALPKQLESKTITSALQIVANQISLFINDQRLKDVVSTQTHESERNTRRLDLLRLTSVKIQQNLNREAIFSTLGQELQAIGVGCVVLMATKGTQRPQIVYNSLAHLYPKQHDKMKRMLGSGLFEWSVGHQDDSDLGKAFYRRTAIYSNDLFSCCKYYLPTVDDKKLQKALESIEGEQLIGVPLFAHKQFVGALLAYGIDLTAEDTDAFQIVGNHLGVALANSEAYERCAQFTKSIESLTESVVVTDLEGTIRFANPTAERKYGYVTEDLIGMPYKNLWAENGDSDQLDLPTVTEKESGWDSIRIHRNRFGRKFPVEVTSTVMYDSKGQPAGLMEIIKDISDRQHLEVQLAKSERQFRALFDKVPFSMIVFDQKTRIMQVNQRAEQLFGLAKNELIEKNLTDFLQLGPNDHNNISAAKRLLTSDNSLGVDVTVVRKNGPAQKSRLYTNTIFDSNGYFQFYSCILLDSDQISNLEIKPYEQNPESMLLGSLNSIFFLLDPKKQLMVFSSNGRKNVSAGVPIIGKSFDDMLSKRTAAELNKQVDVVLKSKQPTYKVLQLDLDGDPVPYMVELSPSKDKVGEIASVAGLALDLSRFESSEIKPHATFSIAHLGRYFVKITSERDINKMAENAVTCAREMCNSNAASLMVCDEDGTTMKIVSSIGLSDNFCRANILTKQNIESLYRGSLRPVVVNDFQNRELPNKALLHKENLSTFMAIPVIERSKLWGVIHVYYSDHKKHFSEVDITNATILMNILKTSIQNADMLLQLDQSKKRGNLYQILDNLLSVQDSSKAFRVGLQECIDTVGAQKGILYIAKNYQPLEMVMHLGFDKKVINKPDQLIPIDEISDRAFRENDIITLAVSRVKDSALRSKLKENGVWQISVIPVMDKTKAVGCMCLLSKDPQSFMESEKKHLQAIAQKIAIVQKVGDQNDASHRNNNLLSYLQKTCLDICKANSTTEALLRVCKLSQEFFHGDNSCVIVDDDLKDVETKYLNNGVPDSVFEIIKTKHVSDVFTATQKKRVINIRINECGFLSDDEKSTLENSEILSITIIPLQQFQKTIGLLWLTNRSGSIFVQNNMGVASLFASLISMALSNVDLTTKLSAIEQFRDEVASLSTEAVLIHDLSGLITYANRAAELLLGLPLQEIIGSPLARLFTDAYELPFRSHPAKVRIRKSFEFQTRIQTKARGEIPVMIKARALYTSRQFSGVLLVIVDSSPLLALTMELESQRKMYDDILKRSPAEYWTIEIQKSKFTGGIVKSKKHKFCGIPLDTQQNAGKVKLQSMKKYFEPDSWTSLMSVAQQCWQDEKPVLGLSVAIELNGKRQYYKLDVYPFYRCKELIGVQGFATDVTQQEELCDELRSREAQFNTLIKHSGTVLYHVDTHNRIEILNEFSRDLLGSQFENSQSVELNNLVHPDDVASLIKMFTEMQTSRDITTAEFRVVDATHKTRWLRSTNIPIIDQMGKVFGINGYAKDVSFEKELAKSLESQRKGNQLGVVALGLCDNSAEILLETDEHGKIRVASANVANVLGISPETIVGTQINQIYNKHQTDSFDWSSLNDDTATPALRTIEQKFVKPNKEEIWLKWELHPQFDDQGSYKSIQARAKDVTKERWQRIQIQSKLMEQKEKIDRLDDDLAVQSEKFAGLFESTTDGVIICDHIGKIINANSSACQLLNISQEKILTKNIVDFEVSFSDDKQLKVEDYLKSDEFCQLRERTFETDDGELKTVNTVGNFFPHHNQKTAIIILQDTQRQTELENDLRKIRSRLEAFVEKSSSLILAFDTDGIITDANDIAKQCLVQTKQKICGRKLGDVFEAGEKLAFTKDYAKTLAGEYNIINRYHTDLGGKTTWFEAHWTPYMTENEECSGGQVVLRDVTESYNREIKLRQELNFSKTVLENANDLIVGIDSDGIITFFNKYSENITGYSRDEVIGKNWSNTFLPKDARPPVGQQFVDLVATGVLYSDESRIVTKRKQQRLISWSHMCIRDEDGVPQMVVCIGKDITENRKRIQSELETEKKFRALYENTATPIFQLTQDGRFVDANNATLKLFETTSDQLYLKKFYDFLSNPQIEKNRRLKRLIAGYNQPQVIEVEFQISGRRKILQQTVTPITLNGQRTLFSIGSEMTEQRQMQATLHKKNQELQAFNKVANAIIGKLDNSDLVKAAFSQILEILNVRAGAFFLRDIHTGEISLITHRGLPYKGGKISKSIDWQGWFLEAALAADEPIWSPPDGDTSAESLLIDAHKEKILMYSPKIDGNAIGVICLIVPRSRDFSDDEFNVLKTIGNQVAIALENVRLYELTKRRDRQLSELVTASHTFSARLDQADLLHEIARNSLSVIPSAQGSRILVCQGRKLVQVECAGIRRGETIEIEFPELIAALNGGTAEIKRLRNMVDDFQDEAGNYSFENILGSFVNQHQPVILRNVKNIIRFILAQSRLSTNLEQRGITKLKSLMCAPIYINHRLFALLILEHRSNERAFDSLDIDVLNMYIRQVSVILENMVLYDDAKRRADTFSTLAEAGGLITSCDQLQTTLDALSRKVSDAANFKAVAIGLYNEAEEKINFASVHSRAPLQKAAKKKGTTKYITDLPLLEKVIKAKEALLISNVLGDQRLDKNQRGAFEELGVNSYAAFPLVIQNKVTGLIELMSPEIRQFLIEEEELLSILANQIAEAINSANMMENINTQKQNLEELSKRIIKIQEEERGAISRELHDEIGQALTAMIFNLELMQGQIFKRDEQFQEKLKEAISLAERVIKDVRQLSSDLRPAMLDDLGIIPAIRWYATSFTNTYKTKVQIDTPESVEGLSDEIKLLMYRIVQESLTNVAKHAQADYVSIIVKEFKDAFIMNVIDDGVGFDTDQVTIFRKDSSGLGLPGMKERARLLGGSIKIKSQLGKGTTITAHFPKE